MSQLHPQDSPVISPREAELFEKLRRFLVKKAGLPAGWPARNPAVKNPAPAPKSDPDPMSFAAPEPEVIDPHKAPPHHEAAMQYMRETGCQYETAVEAVGGELDNAPVQLARHNQPEASAPVLYQADPHFESSLHRNTMEFLRSPAGLGLSYHGAQAAFLKSLEAANQPKPEAKTKDRGDPLAYHASALQYMSEHIGCPYTTALDIVRGIA